MKIYLYHWVTQSEVVRTTEAPFVNVSSNGTTIEHLFIWKEGSLTTEGSSIGYS